MNPAVELALEGGSLRFWATCALFRIRRNTPNSSDLASYSIIGRHGTWVAEVILDEMCNDIPLTIDPHHLAFHEFICLSQTSSAKQWIGPQLSIEDDESGLVDDRDNDMSDMSNSGYYSLFNVLVIKPLNVLPTTLAYLRAGIGNISRTAWMAATRMAITQPAMILNTLHASKLDPLCILAMALVVDC